MTRPAEPRPKTCTECGAIFACGPGTGSTPGTCWCQDQPVLPQIDPSKDCVCPVCLKAALAVEAQPA